MSPDAIPWAGSTTWSFAESAPLGVAVTAVFALLARLMRAVSVDGALAGAAVTFLMWAAWPPTFTLLLTVFVLTALATRVGRRRKQRLGTAEPPEGRRATQVLANLGVATLSALAAVHLHQPLLMFACAAALAEAAADTVSSEMGQTLSERAYLITTFRLVPAGTDGGVSVAGTLAGIAAALLVCAVAVPAFVIPRYGVAIVAAAATAGMLFDSLLGATLERRRLLSNNQVNVAGTLFAAALALLLAKLV